MESFLQATSHRDRGQHCHYTGHHYRPRQFRVQVKVWDSKPRGPKERRHIPGDRVEGIRDA